MFRCLSVMTKCILVAFCCLLPVGCAPYSDLPAGTIQRIELSPVVERQEVTVPAVEAEPAPSADYLIGLNDVLFININGRPEFQVAPGTANSRVQGSRVDGNGDVHIPLVGAVQVAGLTVSLAEARIREALRKYLRDPWVVVEMAEFRSQPLYLLGQFRNPGTQYMDRPLNLLQGIALGNGFDVSANLRGARLLRSGKIMPVDVYDLITRADSRANVWLRAGDAIYIPDNLSQQVFVFGAVKKPGPVMMQQGGLNLAQAIANAELRETGYDFHHVRIIRSLSTTRGELLVVDFDRVLRGEALPVQLMGGDIVYVPKSAFGTWNDVIADILPTLQAISAALQPFVNIKFLNQ